jgi:hypothetical protein
VTTKYTPTILTRIKKGQWIEFMGQEFQVQRVDARLRVVVANQGEGTESRYLHVGATRLAVIT